jgi:hypothetical protein
MGKRTTCESAPPKRRIQRRAQLLLTERLEQALDGALFPESLANGFVSPGGDENDRNCMPAETQFPLQLRSGHAGHDNIEKQALRRDNVARRQEVVCRGKCVRREPELLQEVRQRLTHGFVVVDDADERPCICYIRHLRPLSYLCHDTQDALLRQRAR